MFICAKAKRQRQMFSVAKAKRQLQMFICAKAKRQQQLFSARKRSGSDKSAQSLRKSTLVLPKSHTYLISLA
ncbi:hypothetical protein [Lysinibacillus xylanilyticus]|uniref:hypothetical protein n=1 Tax=Lysinibacillus xylanilyticus TaxID=582475 RepID=UPI00381B7BE0